MEALRVYIDESGVGEGQSADTPGGFVFSAAGFIAPAAEWEGFSEKWIDVLTSAGLPDPPELHMKDMLHSRRSFDGWDSEQKRTLLSSLIDLIRDSPLVGYSMTYARGTPADWQGAYSEPVLRTAYLSSGYLHCIADLAKNAASMFLGCDQEISFVCGRNQQSGTIVQLYDGLKESESYPARERLGRITFESPKHHPPLQAADLLAYEARRTVIDTMAGKPERRSVVRLRDNTRITFDQVNKEWLEPFYRRARTDPDFHESQAQIGRDMRRRQRARSRNAKR